MSNRMKDMSSASDGNAGTQGDFLDECWEAASPGHLGTHGNTDTQPDHIGASGTGMRSSVPDRSQSGQEHNSAGNRGKSAVRSRVPKECTQQQDEVAVTVDWMQAARELAGQFKDPSMQQHLWVGFSQCVERFSKERRLDRGCAEREAYGWLVTAVLNLMIDVGMKR